MRRSKKILTFFLMTIFLLCFTMAFLTGCGDDYESDYDDSDTSYDSDYDSYDSGYDDYDSGDYDDWDTDDNGSADWQDVDTDNDGNVSQDEFDQYLDDWEQEMNY